MACKKILNSTHELIGSSKIQQSSKYIQEKTTDLKALNYLTAAHIKEAAKQSKTAYKNHP